MEKRIWDFVYYRNKIDFVFLLEFFLALIYKIIPSMMAVDSRTITVVGDSITAGIGSGDTAKRWPTILADKHHLEV